MAAHIKCIWHVEGEYLIMVIFRKRAYHDSRSDGKALDRTLSNWKLKLCDMVSRWMCDPICDRIEWIKARSLLISKLWHTSGIPDDRFVVEFARNDMRVSGDISALSIIMFRTENNGMCSGFVFRIARMQEDRLTDIRPRNWYRTVAQSTNSLCVHGTHHAHTYPVQVS